MNESKFDWCKELVQIAQDAFAEGDIITLEVDSFDTKNVLEDINRDKKLQKELRECVDFSLDESGKVLKLEPKERVKFRAKGENESYKFAHVASSARYEQPKISAAGYHDWIHCSYSLPSEKTSPPFQKAGVALQVHIAPVASSGYFVAVPSLGINYSPGTKNGETSRNDWFELRKVTVVISCARRNMLQVYPKSKSTCTIVNTTDKINFGTEVTLGLNPQVKFKAGQGKDSGETRERKDWTVAAYLCTPDDDGKQEATISWSPNRGMEKRKYPEELAGITLNLADEKEGPPRAVFDAGPEHLESIKLEIILKFERPTRMKYKLKGTSHAEQKMENVTFKQAP